MHPRRHPDSATYACRAWVITAGYPARHGAPRPWRPALSASCSGNRPWLQHPRGHLLPELFQCMMLCACGKCNLSCRGTMYRYLSARLDPVTQRTVSTILSDWEDSDCSNLAVHHHSRCPTDSSMFDLPPSSDARGSMLCSSPAMGCHAYSNHTSLREALVQIKLIRLQ